MEVVMAGITMNHDVFIMIYYKNIKIDYTFINASVKLSNIPIHSNVSNKWPIRGYNKESISI